MTPVADNPWGQRGTAGVAIPKSLAFRNISLAFGSSNVLDGLSLDVDAGEILVLLGPSGCGKTTLLRVAAGLEQPDDGDLLIDGQSVLRPGRFVEPEQRGVGFVFQDYALFPHLSALANVAFGLRDLPARDREALGRRALSRVGLGDRGDDYPHMLSGGEQQRVALARAVAPRPGALLMDEPFSNLDRRMRDSIREETVALMREIGATAIVVTHDPEEAMRIADRIALMRRGRIVQVGAAEELYNRPIDLFSARFFCDFNEINANVEANVVTTPVGRFDALGWAAGEAVVVCVRPQSIRFNTGGVGAAGRIIARRFLGEIVLFDLAVEGLDNPLQARAPAAAAIGLDGEVSVTIDPGGVLIFPATDGLGSGMRA